MAAAAAYDPIETAFESAIQDFQSSLSNRTLHADILKTRSIDEVYDATDALQAKPGHLRHLSKIEPFLLGMKEYVGVIEQFVQAKPDILSLIWAPIKLLLQWTSVLKQAFDAVINTIADIGNRLPEFQRMVKLFANSNRVKDLLLLFFKDILDFYTIALNFFTLSRWKYFFESVWPRHREKINVVIKNIDKHTLLMRDEVRLEHIQEEHDARLRSLQHFDSTEKEECRQAYRAIRTDVSPKDFGRELDRLQAIMCQGTDEWLMNDATFVKWSSFSETDMQWLWLNGIPGAGKTILASAVIKAVKSKGSVAFAFLNYRQSEQMEPLDIILAMIFQLSADSERLQEVVCQSFVQSSRSSLDDATRVLIEVTKCLGPTYLVIDGLDEINSNNISRLLSSMQNISEQCAEVKILVSSRSDYLIQQRLQQRPTLRADRNNLETIKIFVSVRGHEWLAEQNFPQDVQAEIGTLLTPVADKSKGMFLYAKLILDNIAMLDHPDDIRAELRVLPEELDDVYRRALDRVNSLKPASLKQKAQNILGWTACTPTPMTIQELEQAVLIDPDDPENVKTVSTALNVVKICGPIVEIVDNHVTLVHFSFREFLLSPKVMGSIKPVDALRELSMCCIAYLSQDSHNDDIEDQSMEENVLLGVYRLNRYATIHWLGIVQAYFRLNSSAAIDDRILHQLYKLKELRAQDLAEKGQKIPHAPELRILKTDHQDLYAWLCAIQHHQLSSSGSSAQLYVRKSKHQDHDPTTLANTLRRIYQVVDSILCGNAEHFACQCNVIQRHFGTDPFKCSEPFCPYFTRGFSSRSELRSHFQAHKIIWKCRVKDCTASTERFLSSRMRDMHESTHHGESSSIMWDCQSSPEEIDEDERKALLNDAIISNEIVLVKQLTDRFDFSPDNRTIHREALGHASQDMIQELIDNPKIASNFHSFHDAAVLSKNRSILTVLLGNISSFELYQLSKIISAMLRIDPPFFEREIVAHFHNNRLHSQVLIWPHVLSSVKNSESAIETLIKLWKISILLGHDHGTVPRRSIHPTSALVAVSRSAPHRKLAEILVEHGADVSGGGQVIPPLRWAARWETESAAELMVYLLEQGADPLAEYKWTQACDEPGARNIQKWTGKTWQQHVKDMESARQKPEAPEDLEQSSGTKSSREWS